MGTPGFFPGVLDFTEGRCQSSSKHKSLQNSSCGPDEATHVDDDDDDVTSTMSESSSGISGLDQLLPCKTTERLTSAKLTAPLPGHESDVDSGIVSCQLMDSNHTASISSSETDSSRESTSNEQKSRSASDPTQCVRFDEQLHLSEENIRRSCRKLFATLYSHRFSYPCYNDSEILSKACESSTGSLAEENAQGDKPCSPCNAKPGGHSRLNITKLRNSGREHESQRHRRYFTERQPMENAAVCNTFSTNNTREKDLSVCRNVQNIKKPQYWRSQSDIVHSSPKLTSDMRERKSEKTTPLLFSTSGMPVNGIKSSERNLYRTQGTCSAKDLLSNRQGLSMDQRLAPVSTNGFVSPKRNYFLSSFPSSHQQRNGCHPSFPSNNYHQNRSLMHKSLSCTVLSTSENLSLSLAPHDKRDPTFSRRISDPISVSSLNICEDFRNGGVLERAPHHTPQATTRSSMVRAYARVVPIICDDSNNNCAASSNGGGIKPLLGDSVNDVATNGVIMIKKHTTCPVSPNALPVHSKGTSFTKETTLTGNGAPTVRSIGSTQKSLSYKDLNYSKHSEELNTRPQRGRSNYRNNGGTVYSQPNFSEMSNYNYASHKTPSNVSIPASGRQSASADKSLTLNHFKANGKCKSSKMMEYEALDQSQKNRFNSLPVLDNIVSVDRKDVNHPINAKRGLHQSDFTLYQNRPCPSSSGKSLLDRIQGFTRSAKNAVQKAFSTERIYRPEREERYEAQGQQKLKRSRSFIRGLRERMSKKKRREKKTKVVKHHPTTQVVIKERLNTSWDEPKLGPSAVTHVEGQLLQLNPDGSQVIELTKPPSKPYGFFVARGRIRNCRGVFVSRMRDQETEEHLIGLLGIGDEILEIEGLNVKHADILEVNGLMSQRNSLILTVLPYVCRKD